MIRHNLYRRREGQCESTRRTIWILLRQALYKRDDRRPGGGLRWPRSPIRQHPYEWPDGGIGKYCGGLWIVAALFALAWPTEVRSAAKAPADTLRLTLPEAVAQALQSAPRLAAAEATQRGAAAAVRGARAGGLPSVDLAAGYTHSSDTPAFVLNLPGGPKQAIAPNIPDSWRARATLSIPLFTGGRVAGTVGAARGERDATGSDLDAVRADLVLEATAAYWNLSLQKQAAAVLREALASYESHIEDARQRAAVGLAARNEVLGVEVERDRAELSRVQADGAAAVAEENLRRLLGAGEAVIIVPADDPAAAAAAGAGIKAEGGVGNMESGEMRGTRNDGDGLHADLAASDGFLVARALASRPERAALAARIAGAKARVRAEKGARWPQLAAAAGYDYANPNRRYVPPEEKWKESWDASVNVSISILDSGRISAATARAQAAAEALRHQAIDLDRRIRLDVTSRVIECHTAETALVVSERAVDSAQENEKVTRDRYHEGVASSSDLLDAETKSLRAALDRADAQARLLLARANLDRAVGGQP